MSRWSNRSTGVAPKNGTTTHTITFTAATTGNLLVCVVAGAVTSSFSAGWTKRVSAVGNTELAVATKTATSGESTFTLTHNAADYAVAWTVYEFPAGSTWDKSVFQTGVDYAAAWTGLTAITSGATVFAVESLPVSTTSGTTGLATTWTTPALEDLDSFTAAATTDGPYLTAAYVDNYTGGSLTPAETTTVTGSNPLAGERSTFSVNIAAGGNQSPTASAGPDQTVQATYTAAGVTGPTVTLTGAASSDPDGTIASYAWTQTSGAAVTLSGTGATRTFIAPRFGGTLVFGLTVTDNSGATSAQDTVQVAITGVGYGYVRVAGAWVKRPLFVRRSGAWDSTPSIPAGSYTTTYGATY